MRSIKTEMENLRLSESGCLKSENSCTGGKDQDQDQESALPNELTASELTRDSTSDFDTYSLSLNSLVPPLTGLKFEDNGDVAVRSPDYSLWESIFSDQVLDGDFMLCSPVRNNNNNNNNNNNMPNYNYAPSILGQNLVVSSPPRFPSPLGHHQRGKGLSPLHRVFNSPNNQFMQVDQIESLSLPPLENLLDDDSFDKDNEFIASSWGKLQGGEDSTSSADCYDSLTAVPELLEYLGMPGSTRFSESVASDQQQASVTADNSVYQAAPQSLSQHLQQERQEEQQQLAPQSRMQRQPQQIVHQPNQIQNMHNPLMGPILAPEQEQDSGLQLVHVLLACAEAVSTEDYMSARRYLHHLNRVVSPLGDSMQRVAACFTEALSARLAATLTNKPSTSNLKPFNPFPPDNLEILKIYQILYQACPYIKFAHFTANQAIFEAFEAEERVHVIDLDIVQGYQWPAFMQALAARPGGAPFLRITGVGPSMESVMETGRCLTELALSLHVPFEFHPIGEELEDLKSHMFNRRVGEALAVNSINRLHRVPGNSLGNLLTMIRDQAPNIVTIVEQEASHNGPYFLGRFLEALHYFSAFFDSLDATFPPDSAQRAKVEQHILAPEIRNIVAHEGSERVMRHERLEKWRKIMEGKGFHGVPLSSNAVTQSKILLGLYSCDGYRLTEDKGCLLLGWQDRSLLAASAWRC